VTSIDYGPEHFEEHAYPDVDTAFAVERPAWAKVRWIAIEGVHPYVVNRVREHVGMHTLAAEDVLHGPQRPRAEQYGDHVFIVTQVLDIVDGALAAQQVSLMLKDDLLVSFQPQPASIWLPTLERLRVAGTRLRAGDASYLAYTLLDTGVDRCFPVLERYADQLEELEEQVLSAHAPALLHRIHVIRRELTVLRRVVWPLRDMVAELRRAELSFVSTTTRTYLGDVQDHCVQVIDVVETLRDLASNLTEVYLSVASQRLNEVMRVLTVISTIFIPLSFLAGVYGMNFHAMPELGWRWGYPAFWVSAVLGAAAMLWYFKRRGWLGG